jgi:hypothetical protein
MLDWPGYSHCDDESLPTLDLTPFTNLTHLYLKDQPRVQSIPETLSKLTYLDVGGEYHIKRMNLSPKLELIARRSLMLK